ncbi:hypothetical protein [Qipengyuania sp. JC766]|uniref:hypothetical protein n=1 Tax=Qipengyuania sp. JC766 TaxID=3232139 RepID=UPI003458C9BF
MRQIIGLLAASAAIATLAGCGAGRPVQSAQAAGPAGAGLSGMPPGFEAIPLAECTPPQPARPILWFDAASVAKGGRIEIRPTWVVGSHLWFDAKAGCLRDLSIEPATARFVWDEGRLYLEPDDEADVGTTFVIAGKLQDQELSGTAVQLYDPAAFPLVGTWRQDPAACGDAQAMRELMFDAAGGFSATWLPFERYKDYWGSYSYDPATGALVLEPKGGNNVPGNLGSGKAELDGDTLVLMSASVGSPDGRPPCAQPFTRR